MGLFDFLQPQPLEYYLNQRSPDVLRQTALNHTLCCFSVCIPFDIEMPGMKFLPERPFPLVEVEEGMFMACCLKNYATFRDGGDRVPKCYQRERVTAQHLLELATEKGDPEAPFYLSLIYEYGMTAETLAACRTSKAKALTEEGQNPIAVNQARIHESQNLELAEQYMELAKKRGSELQKPYSLLTDVWMDHGTSWTSGNKLSYICNNLLGAEYRSFYEPWQSLFTPETLQTLSRFMGVLLGFYSGQEFQDTMMDLCGFLTTLVNECGGSKKLFAEKYADLFDHYVFSSEYLDEKIGNLSERAKYLRLHNGCV